jgi:Poly(hydroxyalcanoate) granule associated protein (phasin)
MRTTIQFRTNPVGDAVINASRQVWLASLGAAVVTRDWAQSGAGNVFRTLVKEGTTIESKAFRLVGNRLEGSISKANAVWKHARTTMQATVKQAAETAVTLVQSNLPKSLPKVKLPAMLMPTAPVKAKRAYNKSAAKTKRAYNKSATKAKRVVKARSTKTVKRVTRAVKAATKK